MVLSSVCCVLCVSMYNTKRKKKNERERERERET